MAKKTIKSEYIQTVEKIFHGKPSMSDIKYATLKDSPYYFDKKTMKSFNQTMKDFKVKYFDGKIYIVAPSPYGTYSIREFVCNTSKSEIGNYDQWENSSLELVDDDIQEILKGI